MTPQALLARYEAALGTKDWGVVAPLFHPDACVTFSSGTHKGKAAVQRAIENNFRVIENEDYAMSDVHWVVETDETAVCLFTFAWSGLIGGKPARGGGRGTLVLVKTEGEWQVVTEHLGPAAA